MLIIMHDPPFHAELVVDGTLSARHSLAITTAAGVITLTQDECQQILPAVMHLARYAEPLE